MLILLLMIVLAVLGCMMLFAWESAGRGLLGILQVVMAISLIFVLYYVHPARRCWDMRTVEALAWPKSPFKAEVNYVGSWTEDGNDGYVLKVIDDYGSPQMLKMSKYYVA